MKRLAVPLLLLLCFAAIGTGAYIVYDWACGSEVHWRAA